MNPAKKLKTITVPNPLEAFHESASSAYEATSETIKTEASATVSALWDQLLGVKENPQKMSGDLTAGESIDFTKHKSPSNITHAEKRFQNNNAHSQAEDKGKLVRAESKFRAAGIDYRAEVLGGERRISRETEQMLSRQIQEISNELRQLVNSSKELATQFKDVAVEQRITKPGKYHVSLFQFVLTIVRQARMKVESSGACLSMAKGKKAKQGYWDLFAQQGTSFSMNNERAIATQAG
jgi:hypothetical protein